jgi:HAD superfamily hydrolase (TIGR01490 family)
VGWWSLLYKLSLIDMARAMPKMVVYAQNASAAETLAQARVWFDTMVITHISPIAVKKIAWHRAAGHIVVVISASTQFAVGPVAEYLGLDYVCTQLAVEDDRLTGRIIEPACYGHGKVYWAERFAARQQSRLNDCYFYTDSLSDGPLLERVGWPIAVNPDPRLRRLAAKRGWRVTKFY